MGSCVFRVDASLQIGNGHVMRCLTLADRLRTQGVESLFVSREHPGNLLALVRARGHAVAALAVGGANAGAAPVEADLPAHAAWLDSRWQDDAAQTAAHLHDGAPVDWLVVDHYALDARWEAAMSAHCTQLMVIDDLVDRAHACDLLLDQTHGRMPGDYAERVPPHCDVLAGSDNALLRPGFAALRDASLSRRQSPRLRQLLVSMGGVDGDDATGRVLDALATSALPDDCRITVVMGPAAPWLDRVREHAARLPWPCEVRVGVDDMPPLMAETDLSVGSAGTTAWERCCLGLPSLMVVLADNQQAVAAALGRAGAAEVLGGIDDIPARLAPAIDSLVTQPSRMAAMAVAAGALVDGRGAERVVARMLR